MGHNTATRRRSVALGVLVGVGVVLGIGSVVAAVGYQRNLTQLPGREEFDAFTTYVSGIAQFVSWVSALVAIGLLGVALVMMPPKPRGGRSIARPKVHHGLTDQHRRWTLAAARSGQVWFAASVLGLPFVSAAAMGVPAGYAIGDLGGFIRNSQNAQMWLLQAIVAFTVTALAYGCRSLGQVGFTCYLAVLGLLPSVVVGNVSVGLNHDLATDAALLATLAVGIWVPAGIAAVAPGDVADLRQRLRRYQIISLPGIIVTVVAGVVVTWQGLAGHSLFASGYGWIQVGGGVVGCLLLVNWVIRAVVNSADVGWYSAVVDLTLAGAGIGCWVASNIVVPPRFAIPQSIQVNYLGYSVDTWPTLWTLIGPDRPNILFVTICAIALGAYIVGYTRVRRSGDQWPLHRLVLWILGWLVVLGVSATGLWPYSGATFSIHMVVHMTINMLAPVLIVMGAPITLALRAFRAHRQTSLPGPREVITAMLHWRPLEYLMHPLMVWMYFVTAFYLLYFTPLFDYMMRFHWAHQFMTAHFLFTGVMFYGLVIGEDRPPKPLPHVGKIGYLFAAMPFHAFFAVGILSAETLLAPNFYPTLDVPWVGNLLADQVRGGEITWATGEIPMLIVIIALVIQWFRQDTRDAARLDRAQDSGLDDSFEAYNEMLARLAESDRRQRAEDRSLR